MLRPAPRDVSAAQGLGVWGLGALPEPCCCSPGRPQLWSQCPPGHRGALPALTPILLSPCSTAGAQPRDTHSGELVPYSKWESSFGQSLAERGCIWGLCWPVWVLLHLHVFYSCSPMGPALVRGPALPQSRGLAGGSRVAPAITCFSKHWGERSQKATGSHFSRSLYLVTNAPFTPSASSFPSTVSLNPVFSL